MRKVSNYKCPTCGKKYNSLVTWANHMEKQHPNSIPDGFTPSRYFYFLQTGKKEGSCVVCRKPTRWNEDTCKYERFCDNPKCKEEYREIFKKRMIGKYGKTTLLNDPKQQRKMLEAKKNSGHYTFRDGSKVEYVSTYELDFLKMLDTFKFSGNDIMGPSPHTYYYNYKNDEDKENEGKKFYIPDYYIPSIGLEIEIKQNTSTHPKIIRVDKVKEKCKDEMMKTQKDIRYIKIVDKNYDAFFKLLLDLKDAPIKDSEKEIKKEESITTATEAIKLKYGPSKKKIGTELQAVYNKIGSARSSFANKSVLVKLREISLTYRIKTTDQFLKSQAGLAFDYAIYAYETLKKNKIDCKLMLMMYGMFNSVHAFVVADYQNKCIYMEPFYQKIKGIYVADSFDQIISFILDNMANGGNSDCQVFNITRPKELCGLTVNEAISYMRDSKYSKQIYIDYTPTPELPKFNTYTDSAMESLNRKDLDDEMFGIPSLRKYPLNDRKRVLSAIRFFNFVDKEHEKELADNIIKAIKKYNITDLNPSEKNRFYRYYKEV